jgi:hypothetical protein
MISHTVGVPTIICAVKYIERVGYVIKKNSSNAINQQETNTNEKCTRSSANQKDLQEFQRFNVDGECTLIASWKYKTKEVLSKVRIT